MDVALKLPRRDFLAIIGSLIGVTVLCWLYLAAMARDMTAMEMTQIPVWDTAYFWMMFSMWAIMMVGMMLPSVAPMILIYAAVARKANNDRMPVTSTSAFTAGYLFMWIIFSLMATIAQEQLSQFALLSPMMVANSPTLGATILIAAGIYQQLPVKDQCLKHCRGPIHFISEHWKTGVWGAFRMGIEHGGFCIGCCWMLMALLFVLGVMNLVWIAALSLFVLLEKILPKSWKISLFSGIILIGWGLLVFINNQPN